MTPTIEQVAARRGVQTLTQGLAIDIIVAIALVVMTILPGVETWEDVTRAWPAWLLLVSKSVVQAVAAWALRRWRDASGVEIAPQHAVES